MLPVLALAGGIAVVAIAQNAEDRVMRTINSAPPYKATGPLVSVIVLAYNEEVLLPLLLSSLPNQTYDNLEVIVVDNISSDNTNAVAMNYGGHIITNSDYNLSRSRNLGARYSHGEILCFIDADSIPEAVAIERSVAAIQSGCPLVCTNTCATDSFPYSIARVAYGLIATPPSHGSFAMIPREVFDGIGGFDEELFDRDGRGEDLELGRRIRSRIGPTRYLRNVFVGTSSRRQLKQGLLAPIFRDDRAIRGISPKLS